MKTQDKIVEIIKTRPMFRGIFGLLSVVFGLSIFGILIYSILYLPIKMLIDPNEHYLDYSWFEMYYKGKFLFITIFIFWPVLLYVIISSIVKRLRKIK